MTKAGFNNKSGNSLLDYALIIAIVGMALGGMNIYAKRGVQGRAKLFTDTLIGGQSTHSYTPSAGSFKSTSSQSSNSKRHQFGYGGAPSTEENSTVIYNSETMLKGAAGKVSPDQFFNAWNDVTVP